MVRSSTSERELAVHRQLMRFGEAESLATPMWEQRGTTCSAIEAQLARLWDVPVQTTAEGDPLVTEKGLPHARASVLNLIVTAAGAETADRVVHTLLALGIRHPSRAIVLVADHRAAGDLLDARISTHCNTGGMGDRICYEEVVLTVRGDKAQHLAGIVAPLLIHDLPTFTWRPGDPPFRDPVFDQLVDLSDRLIIDSSDFSDLHAGLRRLAAVERRSGIGDLAWERLSPWQERIAQFFDAPRFRRYLPNLNRMVVRYAVPDKGSRRKRRARGDADLHTGLAPMAQPILLAGWLAAELRWRRSRVVEPLVGGNMRLRLEGRHEMVDLRIQAEPTDQLPAGELTSVRLRSYGETGAAEFIIDRTGDEATVATNADGMTALLRRITMEVPREAELLSQQLIDDRRDPVYEAALHAATGFLAAARTEVAAPGGPSISPAQELGG
jgi:glucose-6-phosphate dehydrogenase assembly protein OpcA